MPPRGTKKPAAAPSLKAENKDSAAEQQHPPQPMRQQRTPRAKRKRAPDSDDDADSTDHANKTAPHDLSASVQRGKLLARDLLSDLGRLVSAPETDRWCAKAKAVEDVFRDLEQCAADAGHRHPPGDVRNTVESEIDCVFAEIQDATPAAAAAAGDAADLVKARFLYKAADIKAKVVAKVVEEEGETLKRQARVTLAKVVEESMEEERNRFEEERKRWEEGWQGVKGRLFGGDQGSEGQG